MEWWLSFIVIMVPLLVLIALGMHVAFAFLLVDLVGLWFFAGGATGLWMVATSAYTSIASYTLLPIPLFMLMGEVLYHSGMIDVILDFVDICIGHLRARLCIVAIGTGTILAAMTGVAMGVVAMLGAILAPEMIKRGYDKKLTLGTILSSGTMAAIIPPSALAVLYGSLAKVSIAGMLIGGILPGLVIAFLYGAYIFILCRLKPQLAPISSIPKTSLANKLVRSTKLIPFGIVIFLVLGLIMMGIATPSEAAATGAMGCYLVALLYRRLNFSVFSKSLSTTMNVFGMIFMIFVGSISFSQLLALSGASAGIAEFAAGLHLSSLMMFVILQLVIFFLAMLMDQISIMMVTVPIFLPVVIALGIDPLWFGIVFLVNIVVGGKTPPFGLMAFTLKGAYPEATIQEIFAGVIPFLVLDIVAVALFIAFPQICLLLPSLL